MTEEYQKKIAQLCQSLGRYSPDAFRFLQEGLEYTVRKQHGPLPSACTEIIKQLEEKGIELEDLAEHFKGKLDSFAGLGQFVGVKYIDAIRSLLENRHVDGEDLCWGLHGLAIERWGMLAPVVLRFWGIRSTRDFGEMVFALVENGLLQKQPDDRIEDFDGVYDFAEAFDGRYEIKIAGASQSSEESE